MNRLIGLWITQILNGSYLTISFFVRGMWWLMLGHGFCETKASLHVQSKALSTCSLSWRKPEQGLPGCGNVKQRCKTPPGTQVSTPIGHSGPHDLWGHRANIRPVNPLFSLFYDSSYNPSTGGKAVEPLLQLTSSLPIQLFERSTKVQLPAHLTKETSSHSKLYQPFKQRLDVLLENLKQQLNSTESLRPETETSKTTSQNCELHSNSFSPFHGWVTQLGLIIILG